MSANRIITVILSVIVFCAILSAADSGPSLGKWEFTGKDSAGVAWTGTLTIAKLDPDRFNTNKYHSMCTLEAESAGSSKGVDTPCTYVPDTRAVTFATGTSMSASSYTAVLSPDGKTLTQGKWTESKKDTAKAGKSGMSVVNTGTWSAKLPSK